MYSLTALEISGYRGEPVPNTFFQQYQETRHAALLLPGLGYTCQMPLFYYPTLLLQALGADVLCVDYAYNRRPDFQTLPPPEQARWLYTDVAAAYNSILSQRSYEQVTVIGKSLGTLAMGHLLTTEALRMDTKAIWLTPLLKNEALRAQIQRYGQHSLFVIGTADPHYSAAYLAEVQAATQGERVVVEGADHSLVINGDVFKTLQAMDQIMHAVQKFLMSEN